MRGQLFDDDLRTELALRRRFPVQEALLRPETRRINRENPNGQADRRISVRPIHRRAGTSKVLGAQSRTQDNILSPPDVKGLVLPRLYLPTRGRPDTRC